MTRRPRKRTTPAARLDAVTTPVCLLDDKRRVILFNAGCEQLTGWGAPEVIGRVCDYVSEPDPASVESVTSSLAPPPEVLAGKPQSVPAYLVHKGGRSVPQLLNFYPLAAADGRVDSVLCVMTPITQPRQARDVNPAQRLHAELAALRVTLRQRFGLKSLVARGEAMRRVLEQVALARAARTPVTLVGEPGTGREHLARLIHYEGEFRNRSFVPLDCRRLPAIDLKLTVRRLLGREPEERGTPPLPILHPGTLYLMNVDHTPRDVQQLLAEAFHATPPPDLRLTAAADADLREALADDRLERDFYYLITPLVIEVPPLRRRGEDLEPLAQAFLEERNRGAERQLGGFSEEVRRLFREYNWPGNLDELAAVVEEARAAAKGPLVELADLPFRFRAGLDGQAVGPALRPKVEPLEPLLERVEREQIELALAQARHNKSKAADLLGITRPRLYRRMEVLGIADLESDGVTG